MELGELYQKQRVLDEIIVDVSTNRMRWECYSKDFLTDRLLALSCEVSELANATRSFKYWSKKPSESKERVISEYVDVLHFFLSVGNTLGFTPREVEEAYEIKYRENIRRQETGY
ncbi:dUTPase [Clostridium estertheticum]|uniref:dUTPase n=1 Tax=Clostridium estertheticum TaxID=238834 RepID=UPI0013EE4758|nr:dUTPase [Clostridium estertheticum]MBZ9608654.1 dUTPase [Clostridium estertheticum]